MRAAKPNDYLKECIADAIIVLIKEKPLEKISIDEIVKKAGVGRATYFRAFNSKNEAITFKFILEIVYRAGLQEAIHESFYRILLTIEHKTDTQRLYREKFYAHGLYGLLDEWVKRGFHETPNEMAQMIIQIVSTPYLPQ